MKKSSKWKKRAVLIGFAGIIGMTTLECKAKEEVTLEQEEAENNLSNYTVVDANNDAIETTEIREISYLLEGKYYQILGYLEKETATEKVYRSITTPENSIIIKTNKEGKTIQYILELNGDLQGKQRIELQEILGDLPVIIVKSLSYEQALKFETLSFISYNYQKFRKDHEETTVLVYKIEDNYQMRLMEYVGKLENKILFQSKSSKDNIWVLGTLNEKKEIVEYQIAGRIEGIVEFVSMDTLPKNLKLSDMEVERLETEYESKQEINDNFHSIENSVEELDNSLRR